MDASRWEMFGWMLTCGCLKLLTINSNQVAPLNQELLDDWFVFFFISFVLVFRVLVVLSFLVCISLFPLFAFVLFVFICWF